MAFIHLVAAHQRRKSTQSGAADMGVPIINIAFRGLPAPGPPVVRYADRGTNERREPTPASATDAALYRETHRGPPRPSLYQ